jgi:peptidoglycan/xylan/chitin deacetylase (PgdA/CDA1 family)
MLLRTLAHQLSPAGPGARLSVLIFHRVHAVADPLFPSEPDAARFDAILGWLSQWFRVLPLDTALAALKAGELPARAAAITFDDGYADNHDVALPLLQRHGTPATFFIATGFLDGGRMWNDSVIEAVRRTRLATLDLRGLGIEGTEQIGVDGLAARRAAIEQLLPRIKYLEPERRQAAVAALATRAETELPTDLMLTTPQVRAMRAAGMQIGAHTVSHPILARLPHAEARREIEQGRADLERAIGEPVPLFAYPNGKPGTDYTPACRDLVQELGFAAAVSTSPGAARAGSDRWQIPRFTPWDAGRLRFGVRLMRNLMS